MENSEINKKKSENSIEANLKINFSIEDEVKRIKYTLGKLDWFVAQGYKINLPDKVKKIVDQGQVPTDDEISESVSSEFNQKEYEEKTQDLIQKWEEAKEVFLEKLATLGLPLQPEYRVSFTKYGVGGSYGLPNKIQINFDYSYARNTSATTFHEIIHLTIENLIKEHNISHWTKERLVDLIYSKFFPAEPRLQRNPEKSERVNEIFSQFFPNIERVVIEISKLDKDEFAAKEKL